MCIRDRYEQFRRKVEFRVADAREKQFEGLEKLLGLGTELEEIPKLKFRLADLYFEKSQFYFFRSQETDDQVYSTESPDEKERLKAQKEVYEKEAKLWSRRATQITKKFVRSIRRIHESPRFFSRSVKIIGAEVKEMMLSMSIVT